MQVLVFSAHPQQAPFCPHAPRTRSPCGHQATGHFLSWSQRVAELAAGTSPAAPGARVQQSSTSPVTVSIWAAGPSHTSWGFALFGDLLEEPAGMTVNGRPDEDTQAHQSSSCLPSSLSAPNPPASCHSPNWASPLSPQDSCACCPLGHARALQIPSCWPHSPSGRPSSSSLSPLTLLLFYLLHLSRYGIVFFIAVAPVPRIQ